ncbi:ABC transporter [Sporosarcina sp. P12(2017)]|uniref:ABC transporter ATP-binding protein n=1 Tax=unclassified Sporosarcina TaxID=2647733 RepID=UPI000C169968|nr:MULTISPECIES: ABC transporter ATP-binding protein [unclassified Sporosarcina]PIC56728.1 ABC transporter [Sporosarcina sp. P10]PIC59945.1 ABC transporter [Sporosarcina sp. P12(2017)]
MQTIIEVENVSKSFGHVNAVDDMSFYVTKGSLFSFLGTNGAGKSTVISIILTALQPDSGSVTVNGFTVGKEDKVIRKEIGVVFQESLLDPLLSVQENLEIRAQLYGMAKQERLAAIQRCAEIVDIHSILKRRYGKLSGGQKRRVDIARALLHQPKILLLDEPTTGLDPQSRQQIWKMIGHLQKEHGMTVFLTTHYIEEAANSDFVIVIKEGRIIAKGTPVELKQQYSADRLFITTTDHTALRTLFQHDDVEFQEETGRYTIDLPSTIAAIPILTKYQSFISSFEVRKSSLDDVFIRIHDRKDV